MWPCCCAPALQAEGLLDGKVFPHFRLAGYYDDNIFITHDDAKGDWITIAAAGLTGGWGAVPNPLSAVREERGVRLVFEDPEAVPGSYLMADYTGSAVLFADTRSEDSFDHETLFRSVWSDPKLTVGAFARFQAATGSEIDVGGRIRHEIFAAGLSGRYELTGKSWLETGFNPTWSHYNGYATAIDWGNESWLHWRALPKTTLGAGLLLDLLDFSGGPTQTRERPLVRLRYEPDACWAFTGRVGWEARQLGSGDGTIVNPVAFGGVEYQPRDGTRLEANVFHDVGASMLLPGETDRRTGVDATLRQRLWQRFSTTISGGYQRLNYHPDRAAEQVARHDDYLFGRFGIAFDVGRWTSATLFYHHQRDRSSEAASSFVDHQVGCELNLVF